jgi:hypothetical protein
MQWCATIMQMNWISLLKAQQTDFLNRVKKPKTADLSLLESRVKGYHSEVMAFAGDSFTKILECSRQQAEILAKNPPPILNILIGSFPFLLIFNVKQKIILSVNKLLIG